MARSKELRIIPLSESDEMREYARVRYYDAEPEIILAHKQAPTPRAEFAMRLLSMNGLLTAATDGEDSAGRAKLRAETPQELVDRAVSIAELAFEAFAVRGWLHTTTPHCEVLDACDAEQREGETA